VRWRGSFKTTTDDVGDDAVKIPPHVFGGDADRFHSLLASPSVASLIASRVVAEVMGQAVYLDRDTGGLAKEIEHERPKRMLFAELQSPWPQTKHSPEPDL